MKKKEMTFADQARKLKKRYSRADYDPVEKKELYEALKQLKEEQEEFREITGVADEEQEEYAIGGNFFDLLYNTNAFSKLPYANTMSPVMPTNIGTNIAKETSQLANVLPNNTFSPISSSIVPSAISTGVSLIGNLAGMIGAKKRAESEQISLPRVAAEQISLEPQREDLRREANTARNVALRNARDVSSPGAAYANQISGVRSIMDSLGSGLGQSYMTEQNTNAQYRNQAALANQQMGAQQTMYNSQIRDKYLTQADQYRDAAFQAIPQGIQDYRAQVSQDQMLSTIGKDYGLYQQNNPNATFREKLMNSLFGTPYGVYNREYINSLNG